MGGKAMRKDAGLDVGSGAISATLRVAEDEDYSVLLLCLFVPTPDAGPNAGTLALGRRLTLKLPAPHHPRGGGYSWSSTTMVGCYRNVDACRFFSALGRHMRDGSLLSVDWSPGFLPVAVESAG